jgi:type I restriction enzyme S subunit
MPLIRIRDVGQDKTDTYYSGEFEDDHVVRQGSILVGMDGDFRVAVWNGPEALLNQRVCRLDVVSSLLRPRLLVLLLQPYLDAIWEETSAVTVKHLSSRTIADIPLPVPPIDEQDEIVRILDTQLARLDAVLGAIQAARVKAAQFRRSLLHAAFTGQLTQPDPLRGGELPDDWSVVALDLLNNSERPICYGILKPGPDVDGGIPYVKVKHIKNRTVAVSDLQRTTPEIEQGFKRSRIKPGDLLVTIRGTYGRTAIVPDSLPRGNITQDTARVHVVGASSRFVQNYVESPQGVGFLNAVAKGVAVRGVNIRDLRQMPVPVPPDDEQAFIIGILETQIERINAALSMADRVEAECGRLRRSLLQAAFSGELTREWRLSNG